MRVTVKKRGNSASVRTPSPIMEAAHVRLDQRVDVRAERGRIDIEPVRARAYDLATLVAGITDENRHVEIDFGGPVGKENALSKGSIAKAGQGSAAAGPERP